MIHSVVFFRQQKQLQRDWNIETSHDMYFHSVYSDLYFLIYREVQNGSEKHICMYREDTCMYSVFLLSYVSFPSLFFNPWNILDFFLWFFLIDLLCNYFSFTCASLKLTGLPQKYLNKSFNLKLVIFSFTIPQYWLHHCELFFFILKHLHGWPVHLYYIS